MDFQKAPDMAMQGQEMIPSCRRHERPQPALTLIVRGNTAAQHDGRITHGVRRSPTREFSPVVRIQKRHAVRGHPYGIDRQQMPGFKVFECHGYLRNRGMIAATVMGTGSSWRISMRLSVS